jgi:hypothetical protein
MKRLLAAMTAALLMVALGSSTAFAAPVKTSVIYNSLADLTPGNSPGNSPSVAFEANQVNEYGNAVTFGGTKRNLSSVVVTMSSWGCTSGHWNSGDCVTTAGASFTEPITLNIYNGDPNVAANLLTSVTQTFTIPYRPSASAKCTGANAGKWYGGSTKTCYNGLATNITFSFSGVTLPDSVIFGIAYNTTDYGYVPIGSSTTCPAGGCGYDSLNVALSTSASVGTTEATWLNSWVAGQTPEIGIWSNPDDLPYRVAAQFNATN